MIAHEDSELIDWLLGIIWERPHGAGDFLKHLASAALHADNDNYPCLRLSLLQIRRRYPDYDYRKGPEMEKA